MENYKPKQHGCYAYFAGTGPDKTKCIQCKQFCLAGDNRMTCHQYTHMKGYRGEKIDPQTLSCKYFIDGKRSVDWNKVDNPDVLSFAMIYHNISEDQLMEACEVSYSTVKRWMRKGAPEKRKNEIALSFPQENPASLGSSEAP